MEVGDLMIRAYRSTRNKYESYKEEQVKMKKKKKKNPVMVKQKYLTLKSKKSSKIHSIC